jgi:hypothetical protein
MVIRTLHPTINLILLNCRYTGGLALQVLYGYQARSNQDELLALASETIDILANRVVSSIGIWPVDIIPARKCSIQLPSANAIIIFGSKAHPDLVPWSWIQAKCYQMESKTRGICQQAI